MSARVGLMLSGCGVLDGSEIHEAVSILVSLDRRGAQVIYLAPEMRQAKVIDHITGKPVSGQRRDVLVESARIARGKIRDVASVHADDLDALVFPGGYGVTMNLSDYATHPQKPTVHTEVARLMREMHAARKPIGLACIAPVLAAAVFGTVASTGAAPAHPPRLTIGTDAETARNIEAMGALHQPVGPTEVVVDEDNRLVTTPCYMNDVGPWIVYQGAERMVEEVLRLTGDISSMVRGHLAGGVAQGND
jgi:enhancing lycopene biosynthesis protein 2